MATTRVYNITPTNDGSGNITAMIELLQDGAGTGLRSTVTLDAAQIADLLALFATDGLEAVKARLLAVAGEIDGRFTAESITAYLAGNAASAASVSAIMGAIVFPLDIEVG